MDKFLTLLPNSVQIYTGTIADIPLGYALCNGQISNGVQTPTLTGYIRSKSSMADEANEVGSVLTYTTPLPGVLNEIVVDSEDDHVHSKRASFNTNVSANHRHNNITFNTTTQCNRGMSTRNVGGSGNTYRSVNRPDNAGTENETVSGNIPTNGNMNLGGGHGHSYPSSPTYTNNYSNVNSSHNVAREGVTGSVENKHPNRAEAAHTHTFNASDDVTEPVHKEVLYIMWVGY